MPATPTIIAFLRGINVGGKHKLPMAELRRELSALGLDNARTLLNSGNAAFDTDLPDLDNLQTKIELHLTQIFGFPVPVILRTKSEIADLAMRNPFREVNAHKDIRLYVSFLKQAPRLDFTLPWTSPDNSYQIIEIADRTIFSVLDLSSTKTPKGMEELERLFGKEITTRNWNTILKVVEM
jgi:uncharacterized protein (DUF1697 family)